MPHVEPSPVCPGDQRVAVEVELLLRPVVRSLPESEQRLEPVHGGSKGGNVERLGKTVACRDGMDGADSVRVIGQFLVGEGASTRAWMALLQRSL